jgi:hypothetical protein
MTRYFSYWARSAAIPLLGICTKEMRILGRRYLHFRKEASDASLQAQQDVEIAEQSKQDALEASLQAQQDVESVEQSK